MAVTGQDFEPVLRVRYIPYTDSRSSRLKNRLWCWWLNLSFRVGMLRPKNRTTMKKIAVLLNEDYHGPFYGRD